MPNTLVHIGLQGVVTRAVIRESDFKWICVGCVIPDFPWILQRLVVAFGQGVFNLYDFRLYAIVQTSLLACLTLSLAIALFSSSPRRVFTLLAFNSALHLVLDGLETKWANGVHLFAPFSWELWNPGLVWPESLVIVAATIWGFVFFFYGWRREPGQPVELSLGLHVRTALGVCLLALYLAAPPLFMRGPARANNHYIEVLRNTDQRTGAYVECDRCRFARESGVGILRTFTGDELILKDAPEMENGVVSLRGQFVDENTVKAHEVREHWPRFRDLSTIVGLSLIGLVWLAWLAGHLLAKGGSRLSLGRER